MTLAERIQRLSDQIAADQAAIGYADGRAYQEGLRDISAARGALAKLKAGLKDSPKRRAADLGVIHMAQKQIDIDDDRHRQECKAVSWEVTGSMTDTSAAMTPDERRALIRRYQSMGASAGQAGRGKRGNRRRYESRPSVPQDRDGMMRWIEALLAEKKRIEGLDWMPWRYADGIAERITAERVDAVRFVQDIDELRRIGQALQMHVRRIERKATGAPE